ncbi:MAG TPA: hypothetical protein VFF04_01565 [Candidatus Babeliales bacterium]|nr:hypothetical protein [Candidatus Babeliales bacterium]
MKRIINILYPERYISVGHQLIFLIITCGILSALLYKPVVEFHPIGAQPNIKPASELTTQKKKPAQVNVGLHITDFLRFDTIRNDFMINAFIWFEFDPQIIKLETIEKFYFTKGDIVHKSDAMLTKKGHSTIALYTIRVQFSTILDYARFPLDDHRLFLNLTNQAVSAEELIYIANPNDYVISENIYISAWQVVGHAVESGYAPVILGTDTTMLQSKTVFALDLSKKDLRQLSLILLPLLFLFYLGLFTFSIKDITVAMTIPLASVAGLFAYSFVIQTLAPMVGYMMMSDYLFLFFLFSSFIIFLIKSLEAVPETILSRKSLRRIEGLTIVILQILLIVVWYYLVDVRNI